MCKTTHSSINSSAKRTLYVQEEACLSTGEGQEWQDKATCASPASCSHAQGLPTSCRAAGAVPQQERCWVEQGNGIWVTGSCTSLS